jgi:hypothetical protein
MRVAVGVVLVFLVTANYSQQIPQKYFVAFTDKNGTPYSISDPQAFLTQRAIDRRTAQGITITEEDLPVTPGYVTGVSAKGVQVYSLSKWFNGITVQANDSSVLPSIRALPYVLSVIRVSAYNSKKSAGPLNNVLLEDRLNSAVQYGNKSPGSATTFDYGPSYAQIHLENGDVLHNSGYRGQGKVIAVLDLGFLNVDINTSFDSLRANNQILGTRDFVTPGADVYRADNHGAAVLSTMACDAPGDLIGTAPKASYWLFRTDDAAFDNIVEEYNWEAAAEVADSVGADIISSSLGYNVFENNWMDHTCADMNGTTNPSTRGANIAASKGMAISLSAGNSGGSGWTCVLSPADAVDALGVGGTDSNGNYASFSSTGTVNGGYVKPNIACMAVNCRVASPDNSFGYSSGTSFSAPINAGLMACLWQAWPDITASHLQLAVEESASQYLHPDSLLGYGIPDFAKAMLTLQVGVQVKNGFRVYPNPFTKSINILADAKITGPVDFGLISMTGQTLLTIRKSIGGAGELVTLDDLPDLVPGMYILKISAGTTSEYLRLVKVQ